MAKKAAKKKAAPAKAEKTEHKFGVAALSKKLGIQDASTRVALRKAGVKKAKDGTYGWDNDKDFGAVVKKLGGDKKEAA